MSIQDDHLRAAMYLWGQAGKHTCLSIHGESMSPLLGEGDQVLLDYDVKGLRPGDLVVFRQDTNLVVHRLLWVSHKNAAVCHFVARGDNNPYPDPPLSSEQIIGRVVSIQRMGVIVQLEAFWWRIVGQLIAWLGRVSVFFCGLPRLKRWVTNHPRVVVSVTAWLLRAALRLHPASQKI